MNRELPSGNLTVSEPENGPVEIVDFPIKTGDFPVRYVNVYSLPDIRSILMPNFLLGMTRFASRLSAESLGIAPWPCRNSKNLRHSKSDGQESQE